ncbi:hypothetical protein ACLB2K_075019 [Fragaria x ananassa]
MNILLSINIFIGELVKRIEQDLQEANTAAKEKKLLHEDCVNKVSFLEKSIKEHDNSREGRLKDLEKKIKETKALLQSASKDLNGSCDRLAGLLKPPIKFWISYYRT